MHGPMFTMPMPGELKNHVFCHYKSLGQSILAALRTPGLLSVCKVYEMCTEECPGKLLPSRHVLVLLG